MQRITIELPESLYAELETVAKACEGGNNFGPAQWASELVASELAARRLPNVEPGRNGGRAPSPVKTHRLVLPDFKLERIA